MLTCLIRTLLFLRDQHNRQHAGDAAQENGGKKRECGGRHVHRHNSSDYLEEKVNRKQDHDRKYCQQPVLDHSRSAKRRLSGRLRSFPRTVRRCLRQSPCCHFGSKGRICPCQRPGSPAACRNDRCTIVRRTACTGAGSSPQSRFALRRCGRIRTTPGRPRRLQDPAPPYGAMRKAPL